MMGKIKIRSYIRNSLKRLKSANYGKKNQQKQNAQKRENSPKVRINLKNQRKRSKRRKILDLNQKANLNEKLDNS